MRAVYPSAALQCHIPSENAPPSSLLQYCKISPACS